MILNLLGNITVIIKYIKFYYIYRHSTNTSKISTVNRAVSVGMVGLASKKIANNGIVIVVEVIFSKLISSKIEE